MATLSGKTSRSSDVPFIPVSKNKKADFLEEQDQLTRAVLTQQMQNFRQVEHKIRFE